jgi:hypothetical protein
MPRNEAKANHDANDNNNNANDNDNANDDNDDANDDNDDANDDYNHANCSARQRRNHTERLRRSRDDRTDTGGAL